MVSLSVILILVVTPLVTNAQEYILVDTQEGTLRGEVRKTVDNKTMYSFEGIPYVEPPVGELRFQQPVAKSPWSGIRDAVQVSPTCPQKFSMSEPTDEDCLYLNVYSPVVPSESGALKPVMIYIHGGCFIMGVAGMMTPDLFVNNDVVFVSLNYRLGILGFLSTSDDVVPGNMGLKDQREALLWVQRNIAAFGGDPDKVTIFGGSAGGASVHYHVLSPQSKGLFKNAIAFSGSALSPWAFSKNATDRAKRFAENLGYQGTDTEDLVEFLRTVDTDTLVSNSKSALSDEDSLSLFTCVWAPSVEPQHESAFLTEEPWVLVSEGRYTHVPYMSGVTSLEQLPQTQPGGKLSTEEQVKNFNENFEEIVGCDLRLPTREEQLRVAHEIKLFYYNDSDITIKDNYTTALFASHLFFVEGVDTVIRSMAKYSSEPVYYYEFSFNGPLSQYEEDAAHGDESLYLSSGAGLDPESEGGRVSRQFAAMLTNFAKYDNPTPELDSLLTVAWTQYNETSPSYLEITAPPLLGRNLFEPYMSIWHDLLP